MSSEQTYVPRAARALARTLIVPTVPTVNPTVPTVPTAPTLPTVPTVPDGSIDLPEIDLPEIECHAIGRTDEFDPETLSFVSVEE